MTRQEISSVLCYLGFAVIVAVTTSRFLKDGSFWLDEAAVALSFRDLDLSQVFDRLLGSQSFPRWYFLLVKSAREIFGYQTMVLRFFPFVFSAIASFLFLRLFRIRFALVPALVLSAIALNLIPPPWFFYSAFVKQYTFDVFLALLPFCLTDDFFDQTLARNERSWRLVLLCLPCALSMTYVIPMLGRVAGWVGLQIGKGGVGRIRIAGPSAALFGSSVLAFLLGLWITDLRFTFGQDDVAAFHRDYVLGGDWKHNMNLARGLIVSWYSGGGQFGSGIGLPKPMLRMFEVLTLVGALRIIWDTLGHGRGAEEAPAVWGSRSLGSLISVFGLVLASPITNYPLQEGRLTLFILFHLQILLLEGVSFLYALLSRRVSENYAALPFSLIFVAILLPTASLSAHALATRNVPSNLRPLLPTIAQHPGLRIVITACSEKEVDSLPEGLGDREVQLLPASFNVRQELRPGEEILALNAFGAKPCRRYLSRLEALAEESRWLSGEGDTAQLMWLRLPEHLPDLTIDFRRRQKTSPDPHIIREVRP